MSEAKKVHPLKRAWLAGVLDSKCYFSKASGYVINFDTNDEGLARKFFADIGIGRLRELERNKGELRAFTVYRWECVSADECREALLLVLPFLSPRQTVRAGDKIRQIERSPHWRKKFPEKVAALESLKKDT